MEINTNSIVIEKNYEATLEKVWNAITNKHQMKEWYFDIPDFKPEVGTTFNFYEPGDAKAYHHQCTITEIIIQQKLQHTWTHPSHSKGISLLSWEIMSDGNKTKVRLTHEGIENFAEAGKDFAKENYETGWNEILGQSLKNFLEK